MKGFQSQRKARTRLQGHIHSAEIINSDRSNQVGNTQYLNQIEFTCSKYISDREQPVILDALKIDGQKACESCLKWQRWAERAQNSMLKIEKDLIQKEKKLRALVISLKNQLAVEREKNTLRTHSDSSIGTEKMKKLKNQLSLNLNQVSETYQPNQICFSRFCQPQISHNALTSQKYSTTKNHQKWNLTESIPIQIWQESSEKCLKNQNQEREISFKKSKGLFHEKNQIQDFQSSRNTLMIQKTGTLRKFEKKYDQFENLRTNQSQRNEYYFKSEEFRVKENSKADKFYCSSDKKDGNMNHIQDNDEGLSSIQVSKRDSRKNSSSSSINEAEKKQVSSQTIKRQVNDDCSQNEEPKFDEHDSKSTLKHLESKSYKKRLSKSYLPVETQKYEEEFLGSNENKRMKKSSIKYDCAIRYDNRLQKSHTHQTLTDCSYLVGEQNVGSYQIRLNYQENDQASKKNRKENNNPERPSQRTEGNKNSEEKNKLLEKLSFENENLKAYNKVLLEKLSNSRPRKY